MCWELGGLHLEFRRVVKAGDKDGKKLEKIAKDLAVSY